MLTAVRELQIPLLAALLLGGCAAKAWRLARTRSLSAVLVPAGLLPLRVRQPAMMTMYATEFALGLGLIATAGQAGAGGPGLPATVVRVGCVIARAVIGVKAVLRVRIDDDLALRPCFLQSVAHHFNIE